MDPRSGDSCNTEKSPEELEMGRRGRLSIRGTKALRLAFPERELEL
jgi:hypothetical protein